MSNHVVINEPNEDTIHWYLDIGSCGNVRLHAQKPGEESVIVLDISAHGTLHRFNSVGVAGLKYEKGYIKVDELQGVLDKA